MVNLAALFSISGTVASLFLLLSPIPAYMRSLKTWNAAGISFEFILATNVCQIAWVLYGLKSSSLEIFASSIVGLVITAVYLLVHRVIIGGVVMFALAYTTSSLFAFAIALKWFSVSLLGWICLVLSIVNSLSALVQTRTALKQRDPALIDSNITAAMFVCSICWAAFGQVVHDLFVLIPNCLGLAITIVNFGVKQWLQGSLWTCVQLPCLQKLSLRYKKSMEESIWV